MSTNDIILSDQKAHSSLRRQLFTLALPVLGEQFLTFCIGLFDVYLSGRLGKSETSAIGLSAYVSWFATMIFSLVGMGTFAIVAISSTDAFT